MSIVQSYRHAQVFGIVFMHEQFDQHEQLDQHEQNDQHEQMYKLLL